jgi:uncharacterized repeat protein (TIGR01451 family)
VLDFDGTALKRGSKKKGQAITNHKKTIRVNDMIKSLGKSTRKLSARLLRGTIICTAILPAAIIFAVPTVSAQNATGDTLIVANGCMDDLFPGSLGCTANDVRVSGVADMTGDGIINEDDITFAPVCDAGATNAGTNCSADPNICIGSDGKSAPDLCGDRCAYPGDTTTFAATFIVELSAQERFDIGLYFGVDGDPNGDGALTGTCSVSTLPETGNFTRPDGTGGSFVDLDTTCNGGGCPQPEDLCGDIDNDNNPIFYDLSTTSNFITATCVGNENGELVLPSCTSWRQSGANEVCLSPDDAFPGSPSKCNCDPEFSVPVNVPPAELKVTKTADPTSVNEPGGTVEFDVAVMNTGIDPNNNVNLVDPGGLTDDMYGDITQVQGDILSTTCSVPNEITPGGTYTCSFTATVTGNGGESHDNVVTAWGVDAHGQDISGSDDATVDILDVQPAISVTKTANPTSVLEGSGTSATFTVVVDNDSVADVLTLTSLTDDIYGDLNGKGDCATGGTIAIGGSYSCSFTGVVDGPAFSSHTNTVTATGQDDEINSVSGSDSATVTILDDVAKIKLTKTANPTAVNEPGDDVTFTFTVNNLSAVDTVTISELTDTIYGNLNGKGGCTVPQRIGPLGSYSCSFTTPVSGDAGDTHTNVATAKGTDDDGKQVQASDDATVNFTDVQPAASLTKTVSQVVATFDVKVTNDSSAEALELTLLDDNVFGDITQVQGDISSTTCSVPQTIAIGGSYTCSFDGKISTSPHTDTVTGTVSDDDGGSVRPSDSAEVTFGDPTP